MNVATTAAGIFAAAREGQPVTTLPEEVRPRTMEEAEAIQHATLAALGEACGGWKVGRMEGLFFSAPIPSGRVHATEEPALPLPAGSRIELELALVLDTDLTPDAVAALRPETLPSVASLATLIEFVRSRFVSSVAVSPLDRIADCISNQAVVLRTNAAAWSPALLDTPPAARLLQDGHVVAEHTGPHPAVPLAPVLDAWLARCRQEERGLRAGEVVTLGSLTGILPVPTGGARYVGEIAGLAPVRCGVSPLEIRA